MLRKFIEYTKTFNCVLISKTKFTSKTCLNQKFVRTLITLTLFCNQKNGLKFVYVNFKFHWAVYKIRNYRSKL